MPHQAKLVEAAVRTISFYHASHRSTLKYQVSAADPEAAPAATRYHYIFHAKKIALVLQRPLENIKFHPLGGQITTHLLGIPRCVDQLHLKGSTAKFQSLRLS